jgi:tRNA dimethylallyltransferase
VAGEPLLVVILGPTGSGKTALSIFLAECFHGEIVNCDSVAMYREFEIGTAKPSAEERVRAPHHLLDFVDPMSEISAGEYARLTRAVLEQIKSRDALPIVVGGTGLYLRALLEGLSPGPRRCEALRLRLRGCASRHDSGYVHRMLRRLDRASAERIHPNDTPKLIRAIEVCLSSRQGMSELWKQGRDPVHGFHIVRLGLNPDRSALYERINRRAQLMFEGGLIDETHRLLEKHGPDAQPLNSLGYKQAIQVLRNEIDESSAIAAAQQAHRNYAKRQMTWFRREPQVAWFSGFGDEARAREWAVNQITSAGRNVAFPRED